MATTAEIPLDYDALLTPFAEMLAAEGFAVEGSRPFVDPGITGTWTVANKEGYLVAAQCVGAGTKWQFMVAQHAPGQPPKLLLNWIGLDWPKELQYLIGRVIRIDKEAKQEAASTATAPPAPVP